MRHGEADDQSSCGATQISVQRQILPSDSRKSHSSPKDSRADGPCSLTGKDSRQGQSQEGLLRELTKILPPKRSNFFLGVPGTAANTRTDAFGRWIQQFCSCSCSPEAAKAALNPTLAICPAAQKIHNSILHRVTSTSVTKDISPIC